MVRNLSWAGTWMRIVAAADLLSVFLVNALVQAPGPGRQADAGAAVGGVLCGLVIIVPLAALLWLAGGALREARLRGGAQHTALLVGLGYGMVGGFVVLVCFSNRPFPATEFDFLALFVAGAMALATFLVSGVAVITRRQAIAAQRPRCLGEFPDEADIEPAPPEAMYRTPYQVVRSAARSLRLASLVLVLWYPFSCCCMSVRADVHPHAVYWVSVLWAAGLLPLALMLGAAYYLDQMRRRAAVIAGGIGALLVSLGFAVDFLISLAQLTGRHPRGEEIVPLLILGWAVSFAGALSSFIAGIHALRVAGDPAVRRELRETASAVWGIFH